METDRFKIPIAFIFIITLIFFAVFFSVIPVVNFIVGKAVSGRAADPEVVRAVLYRLAIILALFISYISLRLIFRDAPGKKEEKEPKKNLLAIVLSVVLAGTFIRLMLAFICYGNYDMNSYSIISDIVIKGGNVYAETFRYNYSPLWSFAVGAVKQVQILFPVFPYHFLMKSLMCYIDLLTLFFLILIAIEIKAPVARTALFFYLNPVSFLLTGYHGQFESAALLMVVIGLYGYLRLKDKPVWGKGILWIFTTLGMIVKHSVFYEVIICLNYTIKRHWVKLLLFTISVSLFLLSFVPYWDKGREGIMYNVFGYSSFPGYYGITSLFYYPLLKYPFVIAMFIFPFFIKSKDLIKQCLMGLLFFITFTTGISIQYFILPIALGALRPSKGFLVYSLLASMYILGASENLNIPLFSLLRWNFVWIGALYWFFTEWREQSPDRGKVFSFGG